MTPMFLLRAAATLLPLVSPAVALAEPMVDPMTQSSEAAPKPTGPNAAAAPACAAPVPPTGELAPWSSPTPLAAAGDPAKLPALAVGRAADLALLPTPDVRYPVRPAKPGESVSFGGLVGVEIAEAGTYRVALGSGAWVDLVRGGKAVASTAHGHGPECSGVRKMVDFPLTPGRYALQIAATAADHMRVLIARLP